MSSRSQSSHPPSFSHPYFYTTAVGPGVGRLEREVKPPAGFPNGGKAEFILLLKAGYWATGYFWVLNEG